MTDLGSLTYALRANAKVIHDVWMMQPQRRAEYGKQELQDIRETLIGIATLLREINKQETRRAA